MPENEQPEVVRIAEPTGPPPELHRQHVIRLISTPDGYKIIGEHGLQDFVQSAYDDNKKPDGLIYTLKLNPPRTLDFTALQEHRKSIGRVASLAGITRIAVQACMNEGNGKQIEALILKGAAAGNEKVKLPAPVKNASVADIAVSPAFAAQQEEFRASNRRRAAKRASGEIEQDHQRETLEDPRAIAALIALLEYEAEKEARKKGKGKVAGVATFLLQTARAHQNDAESPPIVRVVNNALSPQHKNASLRDEARRVLSNIGGRAFSEPNMLERADQCHQMVHLLLTKNAPKKGGTDSPGSDDRYRRMVQALKKEGE